MNLPSHGRGHAECAVPESTEYIIILSIIAKFIYVIISLVPNFPSRAIVKDKFTRHFMTVHTYFYVLCQYSTYSPRKGSFGYPH